MLNNLFSAHVEAKIAVSSAGLPVLAIWQNHCCSTLGKGQRDWSEVKVINEEQQTTKIRCDMQPCSNGNAGRRLFCLIFFDD